MPTFVGRLSWTTDQGVRTVKDTSKGIQTARKRAKTLGIEIKHVFLTTGEFDILASADAKDGDSMAKMAGAEGNVHTRTIRAWTEPEIAKLISELP
jgi:uncharacterized protein with GYD domain